MKYKPTKFQKQLWFLTEKSERASSYNIYCAYKISGLLDIIKLQKAVDITSREIDILRSQFTWSDDLHANILDEITIPIIFDDISHIIDESTQNKTVSSLLLNAIQKTFDLNNPPFVNLNIIKITKNTFILICVMHHIISDGGSIRSYINRILSEYFDSKSKTKNISDYDNNFIKFANSSIEKDNTIPLAKYNECINDWNKFTDNHRSLELPFDYEIPAKENYQGGVFHSEIPASLNERIQNLCNIYGCTYYTLILAIYSLTLHRYSQQDNFFIGMPFNSRISRTSNAIGPFIEMLPMPVSINIENNFADFVAEIQKIMLFLFEHHDSIHDDILNKLKPNYTQSKNAIYQTLLVLQTLPFENIKKNDLYLENIICHNGYCKLDFEFYIVPKSSMDQSCKIYCEYKTSLFSSKTIQDVIDYFLTLISKITIDFNQKIKDIIYSTDKKFLILYEQLNSTTKNYNFSKSVIQYFQEHADKNPNSIAIYDIQRDLTSINYTYQQFSSYIKKLSIFLKSRDVKRNDIVAVMIPKSYDMLAAIYATLLSGASYLPIDVRWPSTRIDTILNDAKPACLLTDMHCIGLLFDVNYAYKNTINLSVLQDQINSIDIQNYVDKDVFSGLETLNAYVIYTSGTTGIPKGVVNSHQSLINRILWMKERLNFNAKDRVIQKTPICFDVSVWELILPLMYGASIVLPPENIYEKPLELIEIIDKYSITTIHFIPSMLNIFIDLYDNKNTYLKHCICSGEPLLASLVNRFIQKYPTIELYNFYGPTEACIDVTYWHAQKTNNNNKIPIGLPISNTSIYILDKNLHPLPQHIKGDIYIGGINLARGYLNNETLTKEKFIQAKVISESEIRLYKTGDLGKIDAAGNIIYLGRCDEQIKVNGIRIELAEIENQFITHKDISQTAAIALHNKSIIQIILFVTLKTTNTEFDENNFLIYLKSLLPKYMLPKRILKIASMPISSSGKIDKKKLIELYNTEAYRPKDYIPAANYTEKLLIKACQHILEIDQLSMRDSFFEIGGDSIRAIQILTYIRKQGYSIRFSDFYNHTSLKELSTKIQKLHGAEKLFTLSLPKVFSQVNTSVLAKYDCRQLADVYPLSKLQAVIYHFSQQNKFSYSAYSTWLMIHNKLKLDTLQTAVNQVIARHPILRSYIDITTNGEPLQLVVKSSAVTIDYIDISFLDRYQVDEYMREWLAEEHSKPFNWLQPPLLRVTVHSLGNDDFYLTVTEPWLDGWSVSIIITDILKHYINLQRNGDFLIPKLETNYAHYVGLETIAVSYKKFYQFWKAYLQDYPVSLIKNSLGICHATGQPRALRYSRVFDAAIYNKIRNIATDCSVSVKHVLLAVHAVVIKSLLGSNKIIFGLMSNARPEIIGSENVAGIFLNVLPFAIEIDDINWTMLITKICQTESLILPNRFYPTENIINDCSKGNEIFDTLFNFTDFRLYREINKSNELLSIQTLDGNDQTYFKLTTHFSIGIDGKTLKLNLDSNQLGSDSTWLKSIADNYVHLVSSLTNNLNAKLNYEITSLAYNNEIYRIKNFQSMKNIWNCFCSSYRKTPDSIAIIYNNEYFNYESIYKVSLQIRGLIAQNTIYHNKRVLVLSNKSPKSLSAILAIFSLGLVYVPVNPNLPNHRIQHIIKDSKPDFIIYESINVNINSNIPHTYLEDFSFNTCSAKKNIPEPEINYENNQAAIMLYTSGSTGKPKGIVLSMGNIMNRFSWMWEHMPFEISKETMCSKSPINFIDSIWDMLGGIIQGVKTLILTQDENNNIHTIITYINKYDITRITLVPTVIKEIVELAEKRSIKLPSLTYCISSGEVLNTDLAHRYQKIAHKAKIYNLYGLTEVMGDITYYEINGNEKGATIPVGQCIPNNMITIIGKNILPLPKGCIGSICASGTQIFLGYSGDNTHSSNPYNTQYDYFNTRDLGYINEAGNLIYVGRSDRQIKIRGIRIDPVEIEAFLEKHPTISRAAIKVNMLHDEAVLVAYVKLNKMTDDSLVNELRAHLKKYIGPEMLPEIFQHIEEFPLTATHKIDYNKLEIAPSSIPSDTTPYDMTLLTENQKKLYSYWSEALQIDTVPLTKSFFELGGNSLKAMRLILRINKGFNINMSIDPIYNSKNFIHLSDYICHHFNIKSSELNVIDQKTSMEDVI